MWISQRWTCSVALAEHPVQCALAIGQVLNGRIDLLLDTEAGWVLIDHKSTQQSAEHWAHLANGYGAQLKAYGEAIRLATGREVREFWLFLPVAGGAVRLDAATSGG